MWVDNLQILWYYNSTRERKAQSHNITISGDCDKNERGQYVQDHHAQGHPQCHRQLREYHERAQ